MELDSTYYIIFIVFYLVGSLPFALIVYKFMSTADPRKSGSMNPGATNMYRIAGPLPGIFTFIGDFLKGFIPHVLEKYKEKNMIDWLHIDLNSSIATKEILEFFSHRLNKNSIIVFDDYGWPNHEESRIEIDKWTMNKSGILWPLPTGQAIFFNF